MKKYDDWMAAWVKGKKNNVRLGQARLATI
jgi:hypothetical protein